MYDNALTPEQAKKILHKKIKWHAPAYIHNTDYCGIAIITNVSYINRRPLTCKVIKGDNLEYAFNEWKTLNVDKPLCFSDGDRYVTFEIIN